MFGQEAQFLCFGKEPILLVPSLEGKSLGPLMVVK